MEYGIKSKELRKLYSESCTKEDEYNWRFANLIVVLSIGIFAYTSKDSRTLLLYINWIFLLITFLSGCCYIYTIRKLLSIYNQKLASIVNKRKVERGFEWTKKLFTKKKFAEKVAKWTYVFMLGFFIISITLFVIFLINPNVLNCLF